MKRILIAIILEGLDGIVELVVLWNDDKSVEAANRSSLYARVYKAARAFSATSRQSLGPSALTTLALFSPIQHGWSNVLLTAQ